MAEGSAAGLDRGHRTICLPIAEEEYGQVVRDPGEFRRLLDGCYVQMPELFPTGFGEGYTMKDLRISVKMDIPLRRIALQRRQLLHGSALVSDAVHDRTQRGRGNAVVSA